MKVNGHGVSNNLEKKEKTRRLTLPDFEAYYKVEVIKTM